MSKHTPHIIESAGLTTAGECRVHVDAFGAVELRWSCAEVSVTAPDAGRDYNGPAVLSVRLTPDEAEGLVSRVLVAMASGVDAAS